MAGSKSAKSREDKTKKRKRDTIEADQDTKRHRKYQKAGKADQGRDKPKDSKKNKSKLQKASETDVSQSPHGKTALFKPTTDGASAWKTSKPMGGRMLDIDPILTEDEE